MRPPRTLLTRRSSGSRTRCGARPSGGKPTKQYSFTPIISPIINIKFLLYLGHVEVLLDGGPEELETGVSGKLFDLVAAIKKRQ